MLKYLTLFALCLSVAMAQLCGGSFGNCPSGQCCSSQGFCGNTTAHCGTGCISGSCSGTPVPKEFNQTTTGTCGRNGPYCPPSLCCSGAGFCGSSDLHCGDKCIQGNCKSGVITPQQARDNGNKGNNGNNGSSASQSGANEMIVLTNLPLGILLIALVLMN
ncbi:hypothetical protein MP638_001381 [Amoeboaphelidium occidentale]|nr:hypothetical protein MP638_001381 [Amoeboaphelidium occidentale]